MPKKKTSGASGACSILDEQDEKNVRARFINFQLLNGFVFNMLKRLTNNVEECLVLAETLFINSQASWNNIACNLNYDVEAYADVASRCQRNHIRFVYR